MPTMRSTLTPLERLLAAYAASTIIQSPRGAPALARQLTALGVPRWLLDNVLLAAGRWSVCDDDRIDAIVDYSAKLTRTPGRMAAPDIERLRALGFADAAIFELNRIVAAQNYVDRMADGLGLQYRADRSARR